jgi:hypothetical protein
VTKDKEGAGQGHRVNGIMLGSQRYGNSKRSTLQPPSIFIENNSLDIWKIV